MWSQRRRRLSQSNRIIAGRKRLKRRRGLPFFLAVASILCVLLTASYLFSLAETSGQGDATDASLRGLPRHDIKNHTLLALEDWPLIHIVNTRFMQEQGHLATLARARLLLFETFCLPTMVHQTSQSFLWIIKTDPNLTQSIRDDLVLLLKPHPNFFLVGSNQNYQIGQGPGSWRDGSEGKDLFSNSIHTGNTRLLRMAHQLRTSKPVLETRLDADDGIHKVFLQYVQQSALKYLSEYKWLYWCSRRHIEWYASPSKQFGLVNPVQHERMCITPGITVGFPVQKQEEEVPQFGHDVLYKEIERIGGCHVDEKNGGGGGDGGGDRNTNLDCVQLVDDLSFVAVRSRTPTSAGMRDTHLERELPDAKSVAVMWNILEKLFFISKKKASDTNQFVQDHMAQIAKENLEGQCTSGHSCKNSSAVLLQKLMKN